MTKNNNIHEGHRKRFLEQIKNMGFYNISELHMLEYLLMYTIPRADTNPIAHRLLKEFKSIHNVFDAPEEALLQIDGVGEKTARFIHSLSGAFFLYNKSKQIKNPKIGTINLLLNYVNAVLPPSKNEQFIILIVNKNFEVKTYKIFNGISHSFVNFDSKELSEFLIKHSASFCIMAHTHPDHTASPSDSDIDTFYRITPLLDSLSIVLLENLIIGEADFYSFKQEILISYNDLIDSTIGDYKYKPTNIIRIPLKRPTKKT